jgi:segregation and condensation protein B
VAIVWKQKVKKRLSPSALETLSIIAYKQPVTRPDIEKIRGVNCDYAIQKLLEKELITLAGKSKLPGRPVLYTTSKKFMDYFGINSMDELPELREIVAEENSVGEAGS